MLKCVHLLFVSACVARLYSLRGVIHKWSVITALWEPQQWVCLGSECVMWPSGTSLGRGLISQLPASHRLSFSLFRPWPMCQRTVSLCWTAAERTGRNGRLLQNSRRRHWLMVKAARPSGTERPIHAELKLTDGVFCSMPSFATYCTDLVYTLPLLYFYFCTVFDSVAWNVFRGLLHIFCTFVLCHWTEIINTTHS